jgi:hypothetical protein
MIKVDGTPRQSDCLPPPGSALRRPPGTGAPTIPRSIRHSRTVIAGRWCTGPFLGSYSSALMIQVRGLRALNPLGGAQRALRKVGCATSGALPVQLNRFITRRDRADFSRQFGSVHTHTLRRGNRDRGNRSDAPPRSRSGYSPCVPALGAAPLVFLRLSRQSSSITFLTRARTAPMLTVPLLYCLQRGLRPKHGPGSLRTSTVGVG